MNGEETVISTLVTQVVCESRATFQMESSATLVFLLVLFNGRNATVCKFILSIWHEPVQQVVMGNSCGSANSIRPHRPARDVPIGPESDLLPLMKQT